MLGTKTVQIEQNIDAVLMEVKNVVIAIKSGKPITEVALGELLRLQTVVLAVKGSITDFQESMPAAVRTVLLGAEDLAMVMLEVSQPL